MTECPFFQAWVTKAVLALSDLQVVDSISFSDKLVVTAAKSRVDACQGVSGSFLRSRNRAFMRAAGVVPTNVSRRSRKRPLQ